MDGMTASWALVGVAACGLLVMGLLAALLLVPLNRARNAKALNYDFDRKKSAYFLGSSGVSSYALTSQVLHEVEWTPAVAEQRQQALLKVLKQRWRLQE